MAAFERVGAGLATGIFLSGCGSTMAPNNNEIQPRLTCDLAEINETTGDIRVALSLGDTALTVPERTIAIVRFDNGQAIQSESLRNDGSGTLPYLVERTAFKEIEGVDIATLQAGDPDRIACSFTDATSDSSPAIKRNLPSAGS